MTYSDYEQYKIRRAQRAIVIAKKALNITGDDYDVIFVVSHTPLKVPYFPEPGWRDIETINLNAYRYDNNQLFYIGYGEASKVLAIYLLPIEYRKTWEGYAQTD